MDTLMPELDVDSLRRVGMRLLCGMTCTLAAIIAAIGFYVGGPGMMAAALLGALLAVYPCLLTLQRRTDAQARIVMSFTVAAMPVLLLYVCQGMAWQTDLHMLFFALLAAASILCDWKAILAATLVIAVHHLGFGMLAPHWIFYGEGTFARIVLHAVILLVEAGTLMWVTQRIVTLFDANTQQAAARQAVEAGVAADTAVRDHELVIVTSTLGAGLTALKAGDLSTAIDADYPPAYAVLKTDFNEAMASLRQLIGAVTNSAHGIRGGSTEIAQASEDLARRTEGNAASLEETSAALVQIDVRLKATAVASGTTVARADQAISTVESGRAVAVEAVAAMGRVSVSAKGIDSVIEGVDKIAFQTRVLAMNAAVEAGRAGDAGRGFAVVADLVSALAMRAEEEAKCARDQLTVTQAEIVSAVAAVHKVDGALETISGDVDAVHVLLGSMARDNQAQSLAMTEIAAAIGSMDKATQQNAAMVEETSAAARSLTVEVDALAEQAGLFNIGRTGAAVAVARPRATPPAVLAAPLPRRPLNRAPRNLRPTDPAKDGWNDF